MRTQLSVNYDLCPGIRGEEPMTRQRHEASTRRLTFFVWILLTIAVLILAPIPAVSQGHESESGGHEGGGGGCGDVFGDLIHIVRDTVTGQPIFAQRWIELSKEEPGYGWGYCPVAVDEDGERLPFLPFSCDIDPIYGDRVVELDYFGRLNGGRTKERNQRMHFDEVISNIKQAGQLRLDSTGRLEMGFGDPELCTVDKDKGGYCSWSTVDSPMESMALYVRLMKYGHFATDPMEEDKWAHGDPAAGIQYHPALGESDWLKFTTAGLENLLPEGDCWDNDNGTFISDCAVPEKLEEEDFNSAAVYLGAAANKTGKITADLVQYLNRFLKITLDTGATLATTDVLPALYEGCWSDADPWTEGDEPSDDFDLTTDLEYDDTCDILEANSAIPGWDVYDEFTNVRETFVDFSVSSYKRDSSSDTKADLILEGSDTGIWELARGEKVFNWVADYPNPVKPAKENIHNFVGAASDVLRAIEYIHNYAIPEDLYCKYNPSDCL